MKFKITCRPRIRNSVAQKFISSSLAIGLLLNNTSASLASVLSEDGRYETFEGSNITIPDILEEDRVDVEIEGNTMVNVANQKDPVPITKSYTVEETNHIPLQGEYDGKARPIIEGNTVYYNNDTGELTDTFIEGANLSLVSSFEDQVVTQEMIDTGLEDAENLGKYRVEYKTVGKNKLNVNVNKDTSCHGVSIKYNDDKTMTLDGVATNAFSIPLTTMPIKYDTSKKYLACVNVISGSCTNYRDGASWSLLFYVQDGTNPGFSTGSSFSFEFTPKVETYKPYIWLGYDATSSVSSTFDNFTFSVQILEADTSDTSYEPYKESIKTFYLNSPLLEGDTIEYVDGKATHVKRYNQIILDGSDDEEWFLNTKYSKGGQYVSYASVRGIKPKSDLTIYCDKIKYIGEYNGINDCIWAYNDASLVIQNSTMETIEEFKQWLSENPITVVYPLVQPIYETISEESILCDSYVNGHLDLNSNIPVSKVDFKNWFTLTKYLYPSTSYTVQFESDSKGKIDTVLLESEVLCSNYSVNKGINRFNIATPSTISSTELILDGIGFSLSNLVVTEATDKDFGYFEKMKSVGQDGINGHKIEISSFNNGNLIKGTTFTDGYYVRRSDGKTTEHSDFSYTDYIEVLSNKVIHVYNTNLNYAFYDENKNFVGMARPLTGDEYLTGGDSAFSTLIPSNAKYIRFSVPTKNQSVAKACYVKNGTLNKAVLFDKKSILLNEPLRSLPNGIKDRIIKRNGQWVIERNCWGGTITGNEKFTEGYSDWSNKVFGVSIDYPTKIDADTIMWNSDTIPPRTVNDLVLGGAKGLAIWEYNGFKVFVDVGKETLEETIAYIKDNPITYVYELAKPIYEPLNIDSTINTYLDTTHISTNSTIPANLKVIVDRVVNRAKEYSELAKVNPTIENISLARMWTNKMRESILKDEFQDNIDTITEITDMTLERKTASANLDVYIKSENMLSMNLSTNSITFDDFSGVEDMIKENAVNISINSSLPYNLNAYLATEIQNNDKSSTMNKDILGIKDNSETDYQTFSSTNNKITLKSNCNSGNDKQHDIDLKLNGGIAHEKDVYKTTIKFEAEQK